MVRNLDVDRFYEEHRGGKYVEELRKEWKSEYDFILIDSRTGVTDIGGICTIHLPDILILLATANQQSVEGIVEIAQKANAQRKNLPYDRYSLITLPLLSRFDSQAEFEISQAWLDEFASKLKTCFSNWLPNQLDIREFIEATKIPYIPYFSYGEKLPVIDQGITDPSGLGFAYETIASIIEKNFDEALSVLDNRGLLKTKSAHYVPEETREKKTIEARKYFPKVPPFTIPDSLEAQKIDERRRLQNKIFTYSTDKTVLSRLGIYSSLSLLIGVISLGISLTGAAWFAYGIVGNELASQTNVLSKVGVTGLAYLLGWVFSTFGIRIFGNLILPYAIQIYAWVVLGGIVILQILIMSRLYQQEYLLSNYIKYLSLFGAVMIALVGLHLILERHSLTPFGVLILLTSLVHLYSIVYLYVFKGTVNYGMLWGDIIFFFVTFSVSLLMVAHFGLLNGMRRLIDRMFDPKTNKFVPP